MHLYEALATRVEEWRTAHYRHDDYSAIAEILEWAANPEGGTFRLRAPQMRALETYWYIRLKEGTPRIPDLYSRLFPKKSELREALGLAHPEIGDFLMDNEVAALFDRIRADDQFVRDYRLEALRETLTLDYPSYILALAMGAGKTVLIGAIIATEFAMALEYPDGGFVENALVFAPGKTIIESLRQLAETPYDRILPPRFHKQFAASVKLTFTRDGDPDIPVIDGSAFNVVVTNTEKIRIQKETIRKADFGQITISAGKEEEARTELANRRLQKIASLPNLAVFSDEAHHTYGQALGNELKKVRKTVDYLAENTSVVCVINTTGTPYFQRQPLRDVVIWYGLSQGIRDGILKEVSGNIRAFSFDDEVEAYVAHVVEDFMRDYGAVELPDGTPAKLAMYFPQTDDVERLRPAIEARLAQMGVPATIILEHHTHCENKADFDRFRFKDSPHRIALLVDRGVEGWDVPALFACALARKLKSSNNFVLQAACRCLRQVPGNKVKARVYLSMDNRGILDSQLRETYGETIAELDRAESNTRRAEIRLRKLDIPPLVVKQIVRTVVRKDLRHEALSLSRPEGAGGTSIERVDLGIAERRSDYGLLQQVGDTVRIETAPETVGLYSAAVDLADLYRLDVWAVYDELRRIYEQAAEIPRGHLTELAEQIERQTREYEVREETVERALALVKTSGFEKRTEDGTEVYTAEISYPVDRESLLVRRADLGDKARDFGFHYDPYNFDSKPELAFLEDLLDALNLHRGQVEDIYFTGAITTPDKTDFYVDYRDEDDRWRRYTPDFVIRRKDGKCLIVEIKDARFKATTEEDQRRDERGEAAISVEGRKAVAVRKWEKLDPDRLKYQIIFTSADSLGHDQTAEAHRFVEGEHR